MKLLFILDPLASIRTYKDTSFAMMVEAAGRGHEIHFAPQEGLMWKGGRVVAEHVRLHLLDGEKRLGNPAFHDAHWYRLALPPREMPLADFDAVLMRKDPPFDMEYVTSTWLLEAATRDGARVFNDPRSIRDYSEKLAIAKSPQFTAPSLVTRLMPQLQAFIDAHGDVVLKPLAGMGGESVFRVTDTDPNRNVIVETLTSHGHRTIMAQRFIPEIRDGDKRVLLVGGEPVPYSLARIPKPGESRGNLATGGTGVARPLSERDREIATALAPELWSRGLLLVGLDVIGDYLTEVNVTSPTCFQEITQQTGFNVAGMFVDALERAVSRES
ncbi:MAG TPA: glutathione synthase [Burkholderiales bacterium]|nr:glutathione synthase [Burkholderiales bacterium]